MTMARQTHPLGLYLHIPFCRSKCAYCDFYSLSGREDRMDAYTAALERHLIEVAPQAAQHLVDTVYFGGGTPSYLGEKRLVKLLKAVKKHYHVDSKAEITLEANPDSAGDWKPCGRCGGRASTVSPWGSSPRTTSVSGPWAASTHGSRCRRLWPPAGGPNSRT